MVFIFHAQNCMKWADQLPVSWNGQFCGLCITNYGLGKVSDQLYGMLISHLTFTTLILYQKTDSKAHQPKDEKSKTL